jgi:two-component system OmpR family sensor kinase
MAGANMLAGDRKARPRPWVPLKQLSDRTPLRTKLITAMLALVTMALVAISFTSVYVLRSYLTTEHDGQLQGVYQGISQNVGNAFQGKSPNIAYPVQFTPNIFAGIQQPGSQLSPMNTGNGPWLGGGNVGIPRQQSVPNVPTSLAWATANSGKPITVNAQSGPDTWRVIVSPVTIGNVTGTLVVGYDLGNIGAEIQRLAMVNLVVSVAIIVVLAIVGIAVVQTNLRPLNDIEMTAGEIARGHLDHRIPERNPRTEIGSLGRSLNMMLSQIETAFHAQEESERAAHRSEERMRRFIADASHELRTPLTTIRGFAEYYRQRGGVRKDQNPLSRTGGGASAPVNGHSPDGLSPEDLDHLMQRLESEASRMGLLIEDLLQLARLDQQRPLDMAPVDVLTLAADAVQDARIVAPDRPIDLEVASGAAFLVEGDEQRLRQVIGNLVNNALTHTPPGTPVRVKIASGTLIPPRGSADGQDGRPPAGVPVPAVVLDVEDDGPGMTAEQAQRVFERFYRADQARNRASGGTGLGLAIVAGLVAAHGGTVSVNAVPGQGADFQVKLPLSPDAQVDALDDEDSQTSAY